MKYIVIEIQTADNGTVTPMVSVPYEDRLVAESEYHRVLSYAAVSQLPQHAVVMMASDGRNIKFEVYNHEQEPEPEVEE